MVECDINNSALPKCDITTLGVTFRHVTFWEGTIIYIDRILLSFDPFFILPKEIRGNMTKYSPASVGYNPFFLYFQYRIH